MIAPGEFAARYIAVWNEPDPVARDAAVARLWTVEARAYTAADEHPGLDAITRRVAGA